MSDDDSELFADYWNSYFSWRTGQLDDEAIATVVRSIWQQVNSNAVPDNETARLKKLARMIEDEIAALDEDDDEITWVV
jgi:RNA polymerase-interacting CarD/CdnL/TRCF family regulator